MAIAFVQAKSGQSALLNPATISVTMDSAVTTGNGLIAVVALFSAGGQPGATIAGCGSSSWALDGTTYVQTNLRTNTYSLPNATSNTAIVATSTGSVDGYVSMVVIEVTGQATSSWYDQGTQQLQQTPSNATSGNTGTIAQADEILIGAYFAGNISVPVANLTAAVDTANGWTIAGSALTAAASPNERLTLNTEYKVVASPTAPAAYAATWPNLSVEGVAMIRTYKALSGTPSYEQLAYRWRANDGSLVAP